MCPACKGLGKRVRIDTDRLLDPDRSIEEGAIRHPSYDIGKWYWREIVQSRVVPPRKPIRQLTADERERLLWADGLVIEKVHQGTTYERPFDGVARKLERLHVDKNEDQIPKLAREAYRRLFTEGTCPDCGGARLNEAALAVELAGDWTLGRLVECELTELDRVLADLVERDDYEPIRDVVATLVARMRGTLRHLIDIGVGYLSLNRGVPTLSGGESQRVKMARQLDCDLVDLVYILDEPTVGLHPRDIDHLIAMLRRLRDQGNSVLVVEHDPAVIRAADWVVDIGPGPGDGGGELVFAGGLEDLLRGDGATARALRDGAARPRRGRRPFRDTLRRRECQRQQPAQRHRPDSEGGADLRNRRGRVGQELARRRARGRDPARRGRGHRPAPRRALVPLQPRHLHRRLRRHSQDVRRRQPGLPRPVQLQRQGLLPGVQGPRLPGGRAVVPRRRAPRVQGVRGQALPRGSAGAEATGGAAPSTTVLEMTVTDALAFFAGRSAVDDGRRRSAAITRGLQLLADVGVGYLRLGQPVSTLSGGEAQRLKLATELTRSGNVYVMDEPTTGLHPADIDRLLAIVDRLSRGRQHTVVVIEHNLDVIAAADWIIDLGPEGGRNGGAVVAEGTPEAVAARARDQPHGALPAGTAGAVDRPRGGSNLRCRGRTPPRRAPCPDDDLRRSS